MFITAVCVLFLIKLRWPRNKSLYFSSKIVLYGEAPLRDPNPIPFYCTIFHRKLSDHCIYRAGASYAPDREIMYIRALV